MLKDFPGDSRQTIPIVTLELQGMRHMVSKIIMQKQAEMDSQIQAALDAACTEENIRRVVGESVQRELQTTLQSAIQDYFRFGEGRQAIVAAVDTTFKAVMAECISQANERAKQRPKASKA